MKKKEVLDKHLAFLLSQTERYSKVLAENLVKPTSSPRPATLDAAGSPAVAAAASPSAVVPAASSTDDADAEFVMDAAQLEEEDDEDTMEAEEEIAAALGEAGAEAQAAELAALQAEQALPMAQLLARYKALEAAESKPQTEEAGPSGAAQQAPTVDRSSCGSVPAPAPLPADEEEALEYSVAGEDSEDDEETLEAEEEIAAALGESIDAATERNLLDDEANLPIEELMRRYQQMAAEQGVAVPDDEPEPPVSSDASDGEEEGTATLAEAPEPPGALAPEDSDSKRPMGFVAAAAEAEHAEQAEDEEREYRPAMDSDDDEETMANEEQLAKALGEATDPQVSVSSTSHAALVR